MNIGLLGDVFINVKINLDDKFDPLMNNSGHAVTEYGGRDFELAKKLAKEHNVFFVTSLTSPSTIFVRKIFDKYKIISDYVYDDVCGTGFRIEFNDSETTVIQSTPLHKDLFDLNKDDLLTSIDAMILPDIDESIITTCKKSSIPCYLHMTENQIDNYTIDDDDPDYDKYCQLIKENPIITLDNCLDFFPDKTDPKEIGINKLFDERETK